MKVVGSVGARARVRLRAALLALMATGPAWGAADAGEPGDASATARPPACRPARFIPGGPPFCVQTERQTNSQALTLHVYRADRPGRYRQTDTLTVEDWYGAGKVRIVTPGHGQPDMILAEGTGIRGTGVSQTLRYLIAYRASRFEPVLLESAAHTLDEPQGEARFEGSLSLALRGHLAIATRRGVPVVRVAYQFDGRYEPDQEAAPQARVRRQRRQWQDVLPYCPATASFYGCAPAAGKPAPDHVVRQAIDAAREDFLSRRPDLYQPPTATPDSAPPGMWGLLDNIVDYPGLLPRPRAR